MSFFFFLFFPFPSFSRSLASGVMSQSRTNSKMLALLSFFFFFLMLSLKAQITRCCVPGYGQVYKLPLRFLKVSCYDFIAVWNFKLKKKKSPDYSYWASLRSYYSLYFHCLIKKYAGEMVNSRRLLRSADPRKKETCFLCYCLAVLNKECVY